MHEPAHLSDHLQNRRALAAMSPTVEQGLLFLHVANHAKSQRRVLGRDFSFGERALPIRHRVVAPANEPGLWLERKSAADRAIFGDREVEVAPYP